MRVTGCPHCEGDLHETSRISFPEGGKRVILECRRCGRAHVVPADAVVEDESLNA